ncbi:autotransporter-associated beta strand repeat-containing protein [Luteolibacter sp. LG18]|uniref:beta strand repeat-containing protein n=1 Tax=Luteolibacter sp. LG18 TaxID=2819286 RepID=UPI002B2E75BB|nr:hypothetical protein llg_17520 [Luteolibacter sp. LG18]
MTFVTTAPLVHAATRTWDGGATVAGTNGAGVNMGTAANWSADTLPVAGDTIEFTGFDSATTDLVMTSTLGGSGTGSGLAAFNVNQANALSFSGSTTSFYTRLANGGTFTVSSGAGAITFGTNARMICGAGSSTTESFTWTNDSANAVVYAADTNVAGILGGSGTRNITFTGAGAGGWTFNQIFQQTGAFAVNLTKDGATQLTLAAANAATVAGSTFTMKAGKLNLNNATALFNTNMALLVQGGTLDNTSGAALTLTSNNPQTWNGDFAFGTVDGTANNSLNLGTGAVTLGTTAGTSRTITANGGGTFTVPSVIANGTTANALVKTGNGILRLDAANTFSGGLTLQSGPLHFGGATAAGPGTLTINGGSLVARNGSRTLANSVAVGGDFTLDDITVPNNALNLSGAINLGGSTRVITVADASTGVDSTISGVISNGGFTKAGAGSLTLSAANTFAGATSITGGTLTLNNANPINSTTGVSINGSGAKLVLASAASVSAPVTLTQGGLDGIGTISSLTVANSSGNTLAAGSGATGVLTFGTLTFQGAATLNLRVAGASPDEYLQTTTLETNAAAPVTVNVSNSSTTWSNGTDYTLIQFSSYSSAADASHFTLGTVSGLAPGQTAALINTGTAIVLRITSASLIWTGLQSSDWTTTAVGGSMNWTLGGIAAEFTTGSSVSFDDTAANHLVNLVENITAGSVVFSNTGTNNYTLFSAGGFGIASGSLVKNGNAKLTIATPQTFTGTTTINAGTVEIIETGSLASSSSIANAGSLVLNPDLSAVYANPITGTGSLTKLGGNALTLSGDSTFTGGVDLENGLLNLNSAGALGLGTTALVLNGGSLDNSSAADVSLSSSRPISWNVDMAFTGTHSLSLGSGAVTLGGTGSRTITVVANTLAIGEVKSTTQGLVKEGPGTLVVSGNGGGAAGSVLGGALAVPSGTLQINRTGDAVGGDFTATGLSGTGTITNGAAVVRWLLVNTTGTETFNGTLANGGVGPLGLQKLGTGTLILTGTNSYTGVTTLSAGALNVRSNGALGASAVSGVSRNGYLQLEGGIEIPATVTYTLSNDGTGITPCAVQNVSGANKIDGVVTMTSGGGNPAFQSDAGSLTLAGNITSDQTRSLVLQGASTGANTVSGVISNGTAGTNGVIKNGAGTWTLSGTNTYTGATAVNAGTLAITGNSSAVTGAVTVASGATLAGAGNLGGAVTVASGAHQAISVAATSGAQVTRVISGALTLTAGNILDLTAGATPADGTYTLVTANGGITGTPTTVNLSGITGTVVVSGNSLVLIVGSGYDSWAASKGLTAANNGPTQDPDGDGISNLLEFTLGGEPLTSDRSILPTQTVTPTDFIFTFHRADESEIEITLTFQYGSDLAGWSNVAVGATSAGQVTVTENGAAPDTVVVTIPRSSAVGGKLFGRLRGTKP